MGLFGLPDIKISVPTLSQVTGDVGKAVDNVVRDIGRSDIGKVIEATTAPARNTLRAGESLLRGDVQGAAGNLAYAAFALGPVGKIAGASSTAREVLNNDVVNTMTLGFSKDAAEIATKGKEVSYGRQMNASDWSVLGRQAVRGVTIGAAAAYAPTAWEAAKSVTLKETVGALGTAASIAKNPKQAAAELINNYVPGAGDTIGDIIDVTNPRGGANRSPSSSQPQTQVIQVPGQSGLNMNVILIAGAVAVAGIAAILIFKKR